MQRIKRQDAMEYLFDGRQEPRLAVTPGESFAVETEDAFSGRIRNIQDVQLAHALPTAQVTPRLSNPMGGPICVAGAQKGDVLAVRIERIEVEAVGHTTWNEVRGPLADSRRWSMLAKPTLYAIQHLPGPSGTLRDGRGVVNERVAWDLAPFVGTIGVAPEVEVETSAVGQGPWGGNLDCRHIKEGTTVYLPVYHDGARLYVGDVHASQADTEFYGAADETQATVVLSCEVIKNKKIPFLRLETGASLVSLYCYRPLEDAVETAIVNLMAWIVDEYGIDPEEAYLHTTVNPDFRVHIYQMVRIGRIQYTVGAEIPKRYLTC